MILKRALTLTILLFCVLLYGTPKTLIQSLENWPAGCDTTGKHWVVYNLNQAETHFVTESSVSSQTTTTLWMAQIGNFNGGVNPWDPGDTLIAFGSIDTAYINNPAGYGDNFNHCGFYWLFSDTINSTTPEFWQPADTMRPLPKPIASQEGDSIKIKIRNPDKTTSNINIYSILGYWLWADTTGSGTPSKFDKEVTFIPVNGVAGDTTIHLHPIAGNYQNGQTIYWAYKLVTQPDTTAKGFRQTSPGYATYYFSQNSNPIVVIGIEESQILNPKSEIPKLAIYPNPFREKVSIVLSAEGKGINTLSTQPLAPCLKIYDASGRLVRQWDYATIGQSNQISWDGTDNAGNCLPQGIYFLRLNTSNYSITRKVCKLK